MKAKLLLSTILLITALFCFATPVSAEDWCHTFVVTMQKGDRNDEVTALQTALMKEGLLDISQPTGYFWTLTFNAVVDFQEKYASEILTPIGLTHGTGKVAAATRAKLNQLYGCSDDTDVNTCTPNWQCTSWDICSNGSQTRSCYDSNYCGTTTGVPSQTQSCVYTSLCSENNWTYTMYPTACPSSGTQTKTWTKVGTCTGGVTHSPSEIVTCNYQISTCTSFIYSDWSSCDQSGVQTRTVLSSYPLGCEEGNPTISTACTYILSCTENNWTYTLSSTACPSSGTQTKTWTKVGTCTGGVTHSPSETVTCNYLKPKITLGINSLSNDSGCWIENYHNSRNANYNDDIYLTWVVENVNSCTASGDWAAQGWNGTKSFTTHSVYCSSGILSKITSGSQTLKVTSSGTYTMTCTGPGETVTDSVAVIVYMPSYPYLVYSSSEGANKHNSTLNLSMKCATNTDCGMDTLVNNYFMDSSRCEGNSIVHDYATYTCNKPNASSSSCVRTVAPKVTQTCLSNQACTNGACCTPKTCEQLNGIGVNGKSWFLTVGDVNVSPYKILYADCGVSIACPNPGYDCTKANNCLVQPIGSVGFSGGKHCSSDTDCNVPPSEVGGVSGLPKYIGTPGCNGDNVVQEYIAFVCKNPGTAQSNCVIDTSLKVKQACSLCPLGGTPGEGCYKGICYKGMCCARSVCPKGTTYPDSWYGTDRCGWWINCAD